MASKTRNSGCNWVKLSLAIIDKWKINCFIFTLPLSHKDNEGLLFIFLVDIFLSNVTDLQREKMTLNLGYIQRTSSQSIESKQSVFVQDKEREKNAIKCVIKFELGFEAIQTNKLFFGTSQLMDAILFVGKTLHYFKPFEGLVSASENLVAQ